MGAFIIFFSILLMYETLAQQSVVLDGNTPNAADISVGTNVQEVMVNNSNWNVHITTQYGSTFNISMGSSFGFHSTKRSTISLIINGYVPNATLIGDYADIIGLVSVDNDKFFSFVFRLDDERHAYKIYPQSGFPLATTSNVHDLIYSNGVLDSRFHRWSQNTNGPPDTFTNIKPLYKKQAVMPVTISIENNPINNQVMYQYTDSNDPSPILSALFNTSFATNKGIDIYLSGDSENERFTISSIQIDYSIETTLQPTTNAPTTNNPTTNIPTTISPTTNVPTTDIPTTISPTNIPTMQPTNAPITNHPTTNTPTNNPTSNSPTTGSPTTDLPTSIPTTINPTSNSPTSNKPTTTIPTAGVPTVVPTVVPTQIPSSPPSTHPPSNIPTLVPTIFPTTNNPTVSPITYKPTVSPTKAPITTYKPTEVPTKYHTQYPTKYPSKYPSLSPLLFTTTSINKPITTSTSSMITTFTTTTTSEVIATSSKETTDYESNEHEHKSTLQSTLHNSTGSDSDSDSKILGFIDRSKLEIYIIAISFLFTGIVGSIIIFYIYIHKKRKKRKYKQKEVYMPANSKIELTVDTNVNQIYHPKFTHKRTNTLPMFIDENIEDDTTGTDIEDMYDTNISNNMESYATPNCSTNPTPTVSDYIAQHVRSPSQGLPPPIINEEKDDYLHDDDDDDDCESMYDEEHDGNSDMINGTDNGDTKYSQDIDKGRSSHLISLQKSTSIGITKFDELLKQRLSISLHLEGDHRRKSDAYKNINDDSDNSDVHHDDAIMYDVDTTQTLR